MRWFCLLNYKNIILMAVFICIAVAFSAGVNAAQDWPSYLGPNNNFLPDLKNLPQQLLKKYDGCS